MNIAIYKFNSSTDTLPTFNDGYSYSITDVDNGDGTTTRTIISDSLPTSISFRNKTGLISLSYLDTSNVTSGNGMFNGCSNLTSIDTSSFNTSKIKDMTAMFSDCTSLTKLDLSSFDFSNVTNMYSMFANDVSLTKLDLSNLIVDDTVTLDTMFYRVENLKEFVLLNSNKYTIDRLLNWLSEKGTNDEPGIVLTTIPYTLTKEGWTARIVVAEYTFNRNNDTIPVFNDGFGDVMIECVVKKGNSYRLFDISYPMEIEIYTDDLKFVGIEEDENFIQYIYTDNISGNLANPSQSYFMYGKSESGYSYINLNSNYLDSVTFKVKVKGAGVIIKDEVLNNETTKRIIASNNLPTSINFTYKTGLISLSYLDTSNVTSLKNMFYGCSNLVSIDVSSFDTSKVTDMRSVFFNCPILKTITGLTNWDTKNVTDMNLMFYLCYELSELDLSSWDTRQVTNMGSMFNSCESLSTLNLNNFNTDNVTTISSMFRNCQSLVSLNISNFDVSNASSLYEMFADCTSLISIDMCNFNIGNTAITEYMFYNCNSLVSVNMEDSNTKTINKVISNLPDRTSNNKGTLIVPNPKDSTINTSSAQSKYWNLEDPPQYAFDIDTMTYFISKIKEKFAAISEAKNKVDKEEGKNLSTNNFSNEEKNHIENSFNDVTLVDNILVFYSTSESGDKVIIKTFDLDI